MSKDQKFLLYTTFFGTAVSFAIGYLFWGEKIFNFAFANSQVIVFGFTGSLLVGILKQKKIKTVFAVWAALLFFNLMLQGHGLKIIIIVRDTAYFAALVLSLKIYEIVLLKLNRKGLFLRPVILAVLTCAFIVSFTVMILAVTGTEGIPYKEIITLIFKTGFVIGLGIGIGYDVYLGMERQTEEGRKGGKQEAEVESVMEKAESREQENGER